MKVVQINSVCESGSTGKICVSVSKLLSKQNIENYILYTSNSSDYNLGYQYMSSFEIKIEAAKAKLFGNYGFNSSSATKRLIRKLNEISPDIVHLHNLHGHNVNLDILFSYFKDKKIKLFWTFHDCWAFTGYCMYFDLVHCEKWKINCMRCPQQKKYSLFFDNSMKLYGKKKNLFSNLDLTIITPSHWLANLVKNSFLSKYPVKVIHNGIDLNVFSPKDSNFREKYGVPNSKKIILGVANKWELRKGIDVFVKLFDELESNKFQLVLVGTNREIDRILPSDIISINRTSNQYELAEIYSAADVFVNPTKEDNFPTVNIESLACGTPVVTYNTGGSSECLDPTCGLSVEKDDFRGLIKAIEYVTNTQEINSITCREKAMQFSDSFIFNSYIKLYAHDDF